MNFRKADEADNGEDSTTELAVVTKYFDGTHAKMLLEDGAEVLADQYKHGPRGFVIAEWLDQGKSLELEVPNVCCEDGVLNLQRADLKREPMQKAGGKRPAAYPEAAGQGFAFASKVMKRPSAELVDVSVVKAETVHDDRKIKAAFETD